MVLYNLQEEERALKFIKSEMPLSEEFDPTQGNWIKAKEPSQDKYLLYSVPIAIITCVIMWIVGITLFKQSRVFSFIYFIISFILIIPIHETIHALVFPESIKSDNVIFGMWLEKGIFYAYYEGEMSKKRFILCLLMPLMILSVLPIILMYFLGWNKFVFNFAQLNAFLSCGDILGFFIMAFNLPKGVIVRNKGWETYYRF